MNVPARGEVWLADCGMTAKVRPVVVISIPFRDSDRALTSVVPHTRSLIGSEFEVPIPVRWLDGGAFNVQATFPLSPPRFIRRLGVLNPLQLGQIETALKRWQGLA
jgi:mRNA interferase MazF